MFCITVLEFATDLTKLMGGWCDSDGSEKEGHISIQSPAVLFLRGYATEFCLCTL